MIGMKAARKAIKPVFEESTQRFRGAAGRFVPTPKSMSTGMRGAPTRGPMPRPRAPYRSAPIPVRASNSSPVTMLPTRGPTTGPAIPMGPGRANQAARTSTPRARGARNTRYGSRRSFSLPGSQGAPPKPMPIPATPPPNPSKMGPSFFARHGKKVAAGVVAGGVVGGYAKNRTGKAVDPSTGLPKGVYGY